MRKIKEVLRLRFELGLGQREIARACSISQGAVHSYLKKAAAAGVCWPLPEGWEEPRVEQALFGDQRPIERPRERALPDFAALHQQLQQHRHLTRQLVWEEYRQAHPEGYGYSRFCELYQRWRGKQDVVLRQEHQPGEKGFIDWAGATIPVHDAVTGEVWPASLFVMVTTGLRIYKAFPSFGAKIPQHDFINIPKWLTLGGWLGGDPPALAACLTEAD